MTLYEFNLLALDERCEHVWNMGTYLATRSTQSFKINLYFVEEFYCEVWYDVVDNAIETVKSFKSKEALEPYVDLINLDL